MRKTALLFAAMFAAFGVCAVLDAGEELMPLVPGAFSPVEFDDDGTQFRRVSSADADPGEGKRPALRKNIIRLTMPSLGEKTNAKMRMVEAAPAGPDGTLRFRPLESMPAASMPPNPVSGRGQADIPGLVLPELLAVSRMEQGKAPGARAGFAPIRLPGALALGTEELGEFDPYSVQRTGNPFKDAPGKAEAFPAAVMQSQAWESPLSENNELRPPAVRDAQPAPDAGVPLVPPAPSVAPASSLRPPAVGMGLRPVAAASRQSAPITVAEITLPAAPAGRTVREMPPLPELPVRPYNGGGQARKTEVVSLPPPLPDRETRNKGEFSLLSPSAQSAVASGLSLALPPTALTEGNGAPFFIPPAHTQSVQSAPAVQAQPAWPAVAEGAFLQPGETIIDPQTLAPVSAPQAQRTRQMVQAPAAVRHSVPALRADEFTPMRGMRVY